MWLSKKHHHFINLGFILTLSLFLKIPSLFEPNHYGDEGIYQTIGQAMHRGAFLYRDIWDNKPPLFYLLYSFFNGDQFSLRLLLLIVTLSSITVFYLLARKLFPNNCKITLLTTFIFALAFSLPFLEGNIANAENFMVLPILLAFYLIYDDNKLPRAYARGIPARVRRGGASSFSSASSVEVSTYSLSENKTQRIRFSRLFMAGVLISLAFLLKIVAIFDLGALLVLIIIIMWGRKWLQLKAVVTVLAGFAIPVVITALIFISQGTFKELLSATFSQNVGYVAWGNKLIIAQGWLILKLTILGVFCLWLLWKKENLSPVQLFIFLWFGFSLFNAFFAQRPWIHYLLVLAPSFILLVGSIFQTKKLRFFTIGVVLTTLYLTGAYFWHYGKTLDYYFNFFSFVSGGKNVQDYYGFYGEHVNRDYRVARFLAARTDADNTVFIWGNDAQIYALAKRHPASRYIVAYHMGFSPQAEQETIQSLKKTQPNYFIILLPQNEPLKNLEKLLMINYSLKYKEEGFIVYEKRS